MIELFQYAATIGAGAELEIDCNGPHKCYVREVFFPETVKLRRRSAEDSNERGLTMEIIPSKSAPAVTNLEQLAARNRRAVSRMHATRTGPTFHLSRDAGADRFQNHLTFLSIIARRPAPRCSYE